jgi:hypothetical protein
VRKAWGIIEGFMDAETAQKIRLLDKKGFPEILEQIPRHMLQR